MPLVPASEEIPYWKAAGLLAGLWRHLPTPVDGRGAEIAKGGSLRRKFASTLRTKTIPKPNV
jgi:hypothetical protein